MKLYESNQRLSSVCRFVEVRTQYLRDLATLELSVVILDNFNSLPEAKLSATVLRDAAAYRPSERQILINASMFLDLSDDVSVAVLVHEVAHAVCQRDSIRKRDPIFGIPVAEEIIADLRVCQWGFFDGLIKERLTSYGSQYCEILKQWQVEDEFLRRMTVWYQQHLAGIK
jgi:hypothetical protein